MFRAFAISFQTLLAASIIGGVASLAACDGTSATEGCIFNDVTYAQGEAFDAPDGCNQCVCGGDGAITCTEVDACRLPPNRDAGTPNEPAVEPSVEPAAEPAVEPSVEPGAEPSAEPAVEPAVEPSVEPSPTPEDAGVTDAGTADGGTEPEPDVDGGAPGAPTCDVPEVGVDGCACGYLDRPASVGGDNATFAAACEARPTCESSCCPLGFRPSTTNVAECTPNDSIPPTIDIAASSFSGPGPAWGFEIRAASFGADRCRVTGFAGDRSYDFVSGAYPSVSFTSPTIRYDLSEMNLTFLCDNAFGLAVDRFVLEEASERFEVTPTSEGAAFRGLVCVEDLFEDACSVTVCGGEAVLDEAMPLGGECTGGYVVTLDLPDGPGCAPVDALVLGADQELLARCAGPNGFSHAFKTTMGAALANEP